MHSKSSRQFISLADVDLKRLAASPHFQRAIANLRKRLKGTLSPSEDAIGEVCGRFSILDRMWIEDLAREWNLKPPLPIPQKPWGERPEMAAWLATETPATVNPDSKNHKFVESRSGRTVEPEFCGTEVRTIPGSPKIWYQKSVLKDDDGERYLTISVRLTPDLSEKWLADFSKEALRWTERSTAGTKKPSLRAVAFDALAQTSSRKRWSINHRAEWLCEYFEKRGEPLAISTSKRYVREWMKR